MVSFRKVMIDLERIGKLNRGFLVLPIRRVPFSALEIFHLLLVRIAVAAGGDQGKHKEECT